MRSRAGAPPCIASSWCALSLSLATWRPDPAVDGEHVSIVFRQRPSVAGPEIGGVGADHRIETVVVLQDRFSRQTAATAELEVPAQRFEDARARLPRVDLALVRARGFLAPELM